MLLSLLFLALCYQKVVSLTFYDRYYVVNCTYVVDHTLTEEINFLLPPDLNNAHSFVPNNIFHFIGGIGGTKVLYRIVDSSAYNNKGYLKPVKSVATMEVVDLKTTKTLDHPDIFITQLEAVSPGTTAPLKIIIGGFRNPIHNVIKFKMISDKIRFFKCVNEYKKL